MAGIRAASGLLRRHPVRRPSARPAPVPVPPLPPSRRQGLGRQTWLHRGGGRRVSRLAAAAADAVPAPEVLLRCLLPSSSATARFAAALWRCGLGTRRGDVLLLRGDVGAGKSSLARALIRAAHDDPWLPVPSPTYTLQQSYTEYAAPDPSAPAIHHFDLYRLDRSSPLFVDRLGLADCFRDGVCLVEWAERLAELDARRASEAGTPGGPAYAPEVALDVGIEAVATGQEAGDAWLLASTGFDARRAREAGWEDPMDDGSGDTRPRVVTLSGVGEWGPRWGERVRALEQEIAAAQADLHAADQAAPRVIHGEA